MRVVLGNRDAAYVDEATGKKVKHPKAKRSTVIDTDDELQSLSRVFTDITAAGRGVWASNAADDATPAWVASDNPHMAQLLASHFGGIEVRDLEVPDWLQEPAAKPARKAATAAARKATGGSATLLILGLVLLLARLQPSLKTNAGHDFQAKQMAGAASATAVAKWMALTANTTTPVVGDTALTGEITTGGGGLIRQAATYAHTGGTGTYTLTGSFTANGSDSLPVTIGKMGVFDAASSGNMPFATLISPTATLSASGDALTVTQTVTM